MCASRVGRHTSKIMALPVVQLALMARRSSSAKSWADVTPKPFTLNTWSSVAQPNCSALGSSIFTTVVPRSVMPRFPPESK